MYIKNFDEVIEQVSLHLEDYLQEQGIDTSKHFKCLNPKHEDNNPSCHLLPNKDGAYCFSCNKRFSIFDAAHFIENKPSVGLEWIYENLKYLADKYEIPIQLGELTEEQIYKIDTYKAYKIASSLLSCSQDLDSKYLHKEVEKRKWDYKLLSNMNIGIIKSFDYFITSLQDYGFTLKFLDDIALNNKDLFNNQRLIYTWKDEKNRPIAFVSRDTMFEEKVDRYKLEDKKYKGSKYINTRTIDLFQKSKSFFGIEEAVKSVGPVYIFEGQTDVITARHHGIYNCIAVGGCNLSEDHIMILKQFKLYDIILCFDGDKTGKEKTEEILDNRFAGNRDMRVRVIELPEGMDPDSYLREKGKNDFSLLATWSAFGWKLNKFGEEDDETEICKKMIPYIVNESSPIAREKQVKELAKRTGVSQRSINQELNILLDEKAHRHSRDKQDILDKIIYELKGNPQEAEIILQKAQSDLLELSKINDLDKLSVESFVKSIDDEKEQQEKLGRVNSYKLGPDLIELEEALRGEWKEGVFMCIGGKANVGKSSMLCKILHSIIENNKDVIGIYFTIDDTFAQLMPRFVCIAENSDRLSINMVRQPNYWIKTVGLEETEQRRNIGYKKIRDLATEGRLIIKDVSHGSTISFMETLISYYQDKYPERSIVLILDNFHKLKDFSDKKDERIRFKAMSEAIKNITLRKKCCIISSVEYTKMPPGVKPTNSNVSETIQLIYDANFIMHLYSDLSDNPSSFTVCHEGIDWKGEEVLLPRVECFIEKNKITEIKKTFFLDFFPASSNYKSIKTETVLMESEQRKNKMGNKKQDDFKEVY